MASTADEIRVLHVAGERAGSSYTGDRIQVTTVNDGSEALDRLDDSYTCIIVNDAVSDVDTETIREAVRDRNPRLPVIERDDGVADAGDVAELLATHAARNEEPEATELEILAETSQDVLWMFDRDWSELRFVNSAVEDLFGIRPAELASNATRFLEAIHPEDRTKTRAAMERLSGGESVELEYRVNPEEGFERWAWVFGEPVFDSDGDVTAVAGFARDVTAWKRRETELERHRTVVEASGDPMYMLDAQGRFSFVNDALVDLTGYTREELLGESAQAIMDEEEYDRGSSIIRHLLEQRKRQAKYETELRTADGITIPGENQLSVLYDAEGTTGTDFRGTVGVIRDIRERKRRERRLTALHDVTQELMAASSREEVCRLAVTAARRVLDFHANTVYLHRQGKGLVPIEWTDEARALIGKPPILEGPNSIAWRVYQSGEVQAVDDVRTDPDVYDPDTGVRGELYLPLGDHGILLAASEETEAFDPTAETFGELLAGEIVAVLDRVQREQELVRQNDRLDEFASIVSHDLRNPLTIATGRLDLARRESESEHLDAIDGALERMETLIEELLVYTRMGESATEREPVSLPGIVHSCWAQVETADAELIADVDATINADPNRLRRLFENLYRNAIEHGGSDVAVTVREIDDGFTLVDTGPGIAKDEHDQIFERGYSTREGGIGFGLAIVRQIADSHEWEIEVFESESGGAGFAFTGVEFTN